MNSYVRDYQKRGYKPTKKKPSVRSGDDVSVDKEDDDDPDYVDDVDVSPTVPPEKKKNLSNSDVRQKKPSVRSGDDVSVDKGEDDDDPDDVDADVSPTVPPENKKNPSNSDVRQSSSGDVVMEDMVYSYVTPNYQPQLGPFREFSILFF